MSIGAIVLAAGKGTRMNSDLPKPLHRASGRSLLGWVITALDPVLFRSVVVVVGHGKELVVDSLDADFEGREFRYAEQLSQRGTGDATAVGLSELDLHAPSFADDDHVLVLPGDTPLLTQDLIDGVINTHRESGAAATVVTAVVDDPTGYGRIIRGPAGSRSAVAAIVEHRDATADQLRIDEINSGIYCFRRSLLAPALRMISADNAQGELYVTDVVGVLVEAGHPVAAHVAPAEQISGVNDRAQLADAADNLGRRIVRSLMRSGVGVEHPASTVIEAGVVVEPDAMVLAGSVLRGATKIEAGAVIGPHAHLVDATVGAGAVVESSTVRGATVAPGAQVGPFAYLDQGEAHLDG